MVKLPHIHHFIKWKSTRNECPQLYNVSVCQGGQDLFVKTHWTCCAGPISFRVIVHWLYQTLVCKILLQSQSCSLYIPLPNITPVVWCFCFSRGTGWISRNPPNLAVLVQYFLVWVYIGFTKLWYVKFYYSFSLAAFISRYPISPHKMKINSEWVSPAV